MRELVARHRETVNIYVVHNSARVCIAQEESPMPLRHVVHVGDELPLWAGATSKVLLRDAPASLLERIVQSAPAGRKLLPGLQQGIADTARAGYGVSHGEREVGLSAVAVPILGRQGDVVASLSYSGPTSRFPDLRIPDLIANLQWAAGQLTDRGFDHPLRSPLARRQARSS
jgi:DNA-binding IclR family transcriptional regulator